MKLVLSGILQISFFVRLEQTLKQVQGDGFGWATHKPPNQKEFFGHPELVSGSQKISIDLVSINE